MTELRGGFHRELDRLDISIAGLVDLLPEAIRSAAACVLVSDPGTAERVATWRRLVDDLYADVGHTIEVLVARQAPLGPDLRYLLACLRLVPVLHEAVDQVAEVAGPSHVGVGNDVSPRAAALTEVLADGAAEAWRAVGELWSLREPTAAEVVDELADTTAEARSALFGELAGGAAPLPVALELAVVGRALDRVGRCARMSAAIISPLVSRPAGQRGQEPGHR